MNDINWWRWLSFPVTGFAMVYLMNTGFSFWQSSLIIWLPCLVNFLDGLHRGKAER